MSNAFDNRILGIENTCRIAYEGDGHPLCIRLEEANVTTTCDLTTYEAEDFDDIPFDRDQLVYKIIMHASWLHDAVSELGSMSPDRLAVTASPDDPLVALSATGAYGSATVDFTKDSPLLETSQVPRRSTNSYKFSFIKSASRAMATAAKVSIRCDVQGVLSLQFMIEVDNGSVSFVDFRFVPFVSEDSQGSDASDEDDMRL